jgi:MATE family multidrug resistance protein
MLKSALRGLPSSLAYGPLGMIAIIDCLFVGRLGATSLGAVGFAGNVLAPFYIVTGALSFALVPLVARENLTQGYQGATQQLFQCLRAEAVTGAVSVLFLLALRGHLDLFRQPIDVTAAALPYFDGMIAVLIPVCTFSVLREYSIAVGYPTAPGLFAALALGTKLVLSAVLISGYGPIASLGLAGASLASLIGYGIGTTSFAWFLWRRGRFSHVKWAFAELRRTRFFRNELFSQGLSTALQQLFELGAFYFAGIMAGWLGAAALAAHFVGLNVANAAALLSLSVAQTTSAEVGRRARQGVPGGGSAGWIGTATTTSMMVIVAAAVVLGRGWLFSAAPEYTALAFFLVVELLSDGVQMGLGGALRGLLDARFLATATFVCWWLFCLPVAYLLAFVFHFGIYGLWGAIGATLALTALVLAFRLARHTRTRAVPAADLPLSSFPSAEPFHESN